MATVTKVERQIDDEATAAKQDSETVNFQLTVTETNATPYEVVHAVAAGKPNYNSPHPINSALKVTQATAKRKSASGGSPARNLWVYSVTYGLPETETGGGTGPSGETENSLNIRVRVSGQETTVYTQLQRDEDESAIVNSAGDLYPDPQEVVLYDECIAVSFEKPSIDGNGIANLRGCINASSVSMTVPQGSITYSRSFAENTLLLKSVDYSTTVSSANTAVTAWAVDIVLLYRADGWLRELPEKGFRWYAEDADGNLVLTKYKEQAAYLDADGKKLGEGAELVKTAPIQLNYSDDLAGLLSSI